MRHTRRNQLLFVPDELFEKNAEQTYVQHRN